MNAKPNKYEAEINSMIDKLSEADARSLACLIAMNALARFAYKLDDGRYTVDAQWMSDIDQACTLAGIASPAPDCRVSTADTYGDPSYMRNASRAAWEACNALTGWSAAKSAASCALFAAETFTGPTRRFPGNMGFRTQLTHEAHKRLVDKVKLH